MIRNERQYQAAGAHRRRLLETRAGYEAAPQADPLAQAGLLSSVDWLLQDVEAELAEYEALRAGALREVKAEGLCALPDLLVKARIAGGLTQRQLAERLGLKEQQIQRYEATRYAGASLQRVQAVADALGVQIQERVVLPATPEDKQPAVPPRKGH